MNYNTNILFSERNTRGQKIPTLAFDSIKLPIVVLGTAIKKG